MSKAYKQERIVVPRFNEESGYYTTPLRSKIMSSIRAKNSKPEVILRKALWSNGIRYRKNYKKLPGSPDIVLTKSRIAIFVDGEFWHGYNWEEASKKIKSNRTFWIPKIERNIQRDNENNEALHNKGYTVLRFWEKQVKKELDVCITTILSIITEKNLQGK